MSEGYSYQCENPYCEDKWISASSFYIYDECPSCGSDYILKEKIRIPDRNYTATKEVKRANRKKKKKKKGRQS